VRKIFHDIRIHRKRIRDPIYGYITLLPEELEILECPLFSRLSRIKQLSNAWAIYPGGINTRYQHSLGVMHLAGEFAGNILHRSINEIRGAIDDDQIEGIIRISRLWGLIHDIGHGPFSHAFEYYLLFDKKLDHEMIVPKIYEKDDSFQRAINNFVESTKEYYDDSLSIDLILEFFKKKQPNLENHEVLQIFSKIIKGDIYSLDEIDYILRDSYFCGTKEYGTVDWERIKNLSWIIKLKPTNKCVLALEAKVEQCLVDYYWSKYCMYNAVYFHNRCHAIEKYLKEIFLFLKEENEFNYFLEDYSNYQELDDNTILHKLKFPPDEKKDKESKYTSYYNKLMDIYNFIIPFSFIGKSKNKIINDSLNHLPKHIILALELNFQKQFSEKMEIFLDEEQEDLQNNGETEKASVIERNKIYASGIFFHNIETSTSESLSVNTKKTPFYFLDTNMKKYKIEKTHKVLFKDIPLEDKFSKILVPSQFYNNIVKTYPELFDKIIAYFTTIEFDVPVNIRKNYSIS